MLFQLSATGDCRQSTDASLTQLVLPDEKAVQCDALRP